MKDTMECGRYDAFNTWYLDHTFARGEGTRADNSEHAKVWFNSLGGHEGENRKFPIEFHRKKGYYGLRKNTGETTLPADLVFARVLVEGKVDESIEEYCGGPGAVCGGLVYGITGVCHQMTNTALMACREKGKWYQPDTWYICHPPSNNASWITYGFWGINAGILGFEMRKVYANTSEAIAETYRKGLEGGAASSEVEKLQGRLDRQQRDILKFSLQSVLDQRYDRDERSKSVAATLDIGRGDVSETDYDAFLDLDEDLFRKRHECARMMLQGRVTKEEAVSILNDIAHKTEEALADHLSDLESVGGDVEGDTKKGMVHADEMPDISAYVELSQSLGLMF